MSVDWMPEGLTGWALVLVLLAGVAAGWVDAVVGGGGLLQLPALLLLPGVSPVQALGTNKLGSVFGAATSSLTYYRSVHPDLRVAAPMAAVAAGSSIAGASFAASLPPEVFTPLIVCALVVVAVLTVRRPDIGATEDVSLTTARRLAAGVPIGLVVGFYDGILGPGTGTFFVIAIAALMSLSFLQATATTKFVNLATNLGALAFFATNGSVFWGLGLLLGAANIVGSFLGSRTAIARGSRFVRAILLIVVSALIVRLSYQIWVDTIQPRM